MFDGLKAYHVSTHSRLKAAGHTRYLLPQTCISFNTQPPEGGWRMLPAITMI